MELYLKYPKYQDMGGRLSLGIFMDLAIEAQSEIDYYTFGRLKKFETIPDEVEWCMYKLIQLLADKQAAMGSGSTVDGVTPGIASQSNDGVSISYNVVSASQLIADSQTQMQFTINKYLADVRDSIGRRILYRGMYADE